MKSDENQDRLDKMLVDSLGTHQGEPDFERFCQNHISEVKALKSNRFTKNKAEDDFWGLHFNSLKHMFRPIQIPIGICLLAVFLVIFNVWNFSPSGAGIAWAEVGRKMQTIQDVQFYEFDFRNGAPTDFIKGNYSRGKIERLNSDGSRSIDDGRKCVFTTSDGVFLRETGSEFKNMTDVENMNNLFEVLTKGILQYRQGQLDEQKPTEIADDFLIYHFSPSAAFEPLLESIFITVGKNSLLPVQMKLFYKNNPQRYDIYFFEYSAG